MRIPVYMHASRDCGYTTTHYTFVPTAASALQGTIFAPARTRTLTTPAHAVLLPGDRQPTDLYFAMYFAKRGKRGLAWAPARASDSDEKDASNRIKFLVA